MNLENLQGCFGKDPAKLYVFTGSVPTDAQAVPYITEQFVSAAGTNLVSCVVSEIARTWLVYTKDTQDLGDRFRLLADFPLPEPEPEPEPEPVSDTPSGGETP